VAAVRLLLVDDHPLMIEAVRLALEHDTGFEIVGTAYSSAQVLPLVRRAHPEVVLLDVHLPGVGGLTLLEQLRAEWPGTNVIMLSAVDEPDLIRAALLRGAAAYVLKSIDPTDLPGVLRQTLERTVFHPNIGAGGEMSERPHGISQREVEVLDAVARCGSTQAAAQDLWVTAATVKFHLHNVYRKLGVSNRTAALTWAYSHGLINDGAQAPASLLVHP
jgi:DNA-binding NarL/FixJ family response regulator